MNLAGRIIKTTRANFLPASVIPFLTGALYAARQGVNLSMSRFLLGIGAVVSAHLAGNMFNDYYDYKSGADNVSMKRSPFFGGSRVIQEGIMQPEDVLLQATAASVFALVCGTAICIVTRNPVFLLIMFAAGLLTLEYTAHPLRFAYNRLGEIDIFILFGAGLVTGSFFLFSGRITTGSFLVSLPVSFLIMSVIICNEIPDFDTDMKAGKKNLISIAGKNKGYLVYSLTILLSALSLLANVLLGVLPRTGIAGLPLYAAGMKATHILKTKVGSTDELIGASGITIVLHALVGMFVALLLVIR